MTHNQTKRTCLVILIVVLLMCGVLGMWLWAYWSPYSTFLDEDYRAVPLFHAQIEAILAELPPPPGVVETERFTDRMNSSGAQLYGHELYIVYFLNDNSLKDVVSYYRQILVAKGWSNIPNIRDDETGGSFFRGTVSVYIRDPSVRKEKIYLSVSGKIFLDNHSVLVAQPFDGRITSCSNPRY